MNAPDGLQTSGNFLTIMKTFLVSATIYDGEHEHVSHVLIRAKSLPDAKKIAATLEHEFGSETQDENGEGGETVFGFGDGLTAAKCGTPRQITAAQAKVLTSLNVCHFHN